jgi:hypothetical protein
MFVGDAEVPNRRPDVAVMAPDLGRDQIDGVAPGTGRLAVEFDEPLSSVSEAVAGAYFR